MAEAYLAKFGGDRYASESAGLEPGVLNPFVVKALSEDGIDISGKPTRAVMDLYSAGKTYDWVVTVCSKEAAERCPVFPGKVRRSHWPFDDPSQFTGSDEDIMVRVRALRDAIRVKVREFIVELDGG